MTENMLIRENMVYMSTHVLFWCITWFLWCHESHSNTQCHNKMMYNGAWWSTSMNAFCRVYHLHKIIDKSSQHLFEPAFVISITAYLPKHHTEVLLLQLWDGLLLNSFLNVYCNSRYNSIFSCLCYKIY